MRNILVIASCVISVATGLILARSGKTSTSNPSPEKHVPLVGLSLDTLKEERWQSDRDLFEKGIKSLGGKLLIQSANGDDTRQIADIQALISRHVDALVIVPHNGAAMAKAVNLAHDAGIPVLSRMIV
jgi:D-xylose transport system substrate-binding protein